MISRRDQRKQVMDPTTAPAIRDLPDRVVQIHQARLRELEAKEANLKAILEQIGVMGHCPRCGAEVRRAAFWRLQQGCKRLVDLVLTTDGEDHSECRG